MKAFNQKDMAALPYFTSLFAGRAGLLTFIVQITLFVTFAPGQDLTTLSRPIYVKWSYKTDDVLNLAPAVDGEKAYLPLKNGSIVSVRVADGGLAWKSDFGGAISSAPVADEKSVYVASEVLPPAKSSQPQATGVLRALSRQSGLTSWMRTLPVPVRGTINLNAKNLFFSTSDGRLYAIRKDTGAISWIKYNSSPFSFLQSLRREVIYVSDASGDIVAVEEESGKTIWRYRTRKSLRAPVVAFENMVYSGTADGYVFAVDRLTGRLKWRVRTGAAVQSVLATDRCILATSLDNFIYCLSPQSGGRLWKRQMAGRVAAPPLVLNDSVLLAPLVGDECVVLNLEDGKKTNSIYVGEDNNTEAAPVLTDDTLLLTTREGLLALTDRADRSHSRDSP